MQGNQMRAASERLGYACAPEPNAVRLRGVTRLPERAWLGDLTTRGHHHRNCYLAIFLYPDKAEVHKNLESASPLCAILIMRFAMSSRITNSELPLSSVDIALSKALPIVVVRSGSKAFNRRVNGIMSAILLSNR